MLLFILFIRKVLFILNNEFNVYAIKDALNGFGTISVDSNDDVAVRNFAFAISQGLLSFAASDYSLYRIGSYNIASGALTPCDPQFILNGIDAKHMYA